ncbi:MAG TPA: hypothetical protein VGQ20_13785 [Acidimicrobiales bacterium]|jgi:hypothetical protein|nr:hypothetical protein [Acidimicrobiales bacterium]
MAAAAGADPGRDDAGPDAVEQLQRAVLTLIGAARVTLDALEAMVADRRRLDELAATGRDLVGSLVGIVLGSDDSHRDEGA